MKKILNFIILSLFLTPNISFALSVETYLKKRESNDTVEKFGLDLYIHGVSEGIWMSHMEEQGLVGEGKLNRTVFCAPVSWEPDLKDSYSYLDSQISFIKSKGRDFKNKSVPDLMFDYLIRTYPCK